MVHVGISLMLDDAFRAQMFPLLEAGIVDVVEYSFEVGWTPRGVPAWAQDLLDHFAEHDRLWGHGVTYSPLSAAADAAQQRWLDAVASEVEHRRYQGISEHYGFMGNDGLDLGAPLPLPAHPAVDAVGIEALQRIVARTGLPVGLENLALGLGEPDVRAQGPSLSAILDAVDGYLVLDVHNLFCQLVNFELDLDELLSTYPVHRTHVIHVSGGSWSEHRIGSTSYRIRRDTHDDAVLPEVFELLRRVVPRCQALQAVVFERLGGTLDRGSGARYRHDFARIRDIVRELA